MTSLRSVLRQVRLFEREAHSILSVHESSVSRVVILGETYKQLEKLVSFKQDDLFKQALRCVENELYRGAHVMGWAGFMDYFEEKLASDGFTKLRGARKNWTFKGLEELRESYAEFQLIESARDIGLCSKNEMKALHGLLNKRNECAHPSEYYPDLNDTLGYISELLKRIKTLAPRTL